MTSPRTEAIIAHLTPSASFSGAPLAWQIATASASAAWSGCGGSGSESSAPTIRCTCSLSADAAAADRLLDRLRRVREARHAGHAGGEQHHAARLPDRERAVGVAAEVEVLDRHAPSGSCSRDQVADARVDVGEPALERRARPRLDHAAVERRERAARARRTTP